MTNIHHNYEISFQYYPGDIHKCTPAGKITLPQFIQATRSPKHPEIFDRIKEAKDNGNKALAGKLKESLYSFTPAVIVSGWRNQKSITAFTGLFPIDFDGMTPDQASEFKQYLFNHYPFFYSVWLSASRHGVRGFIRVPVVQTVEEYRSYYFAIEAELSQYEYHFDVMLKNPVLPMFQSYDPDILFRSDHETWTARYVAPPLPPPQPVNIGTNHTDRQRQSAAEIILKGFTSQFSRIANIGHPVVRSIAYTAGGYIAAGYLDESDVLRFMDSWIYSHGYLRQNAATYKRTVRDMISRGKAQPLKLETKSTMNVSAQEIHDLLIV